MNTIVQIILSLIVITSLLMFSMFMPDSISDGVFIGSIFMITIGIGVLLAVIWKATEYDIEPPVRFGSFSKY